MYLRRLVYKCLNCFINGNGWLKRSYLFLNIAFKLIWCCFLFFLFLLYYVLGFFPKNSAICFITLLIRGHKDGMWSTCFSYKMLLKPFQFHSKTIGLVNSTDIYHWVWLWREHVFLLLVKNNYMINITAPCG